MQYFRMIKSGLPSSWRILRHVSPSLKGEARGIAASFAAMILAVGLGILEPWPLKYVLDVLVDTSGSADAANRTATSETVVIVSAVALVVISAGRALAEYFRTVGFALIGNRVITQLRSDLFRHLQHLSLTFHSEARKGELTVRVISDVSMLKDVVISALLPLISSFLILSGMATIMLIIHWKLGLLVIGVFPLFWLVTVRSSRKIHDASRRQRKREGALAATTAESMSAQQTVQALSLQDVFQAEFTSHNQKSQKEGVRTSRLTAGLERSVDVLIAMATAIALWLGARYVKAGDLTAGELVVFLTYLKRGFKPLQDFAKYTGRLAKATAAGERICELLETGNECSDESHAADAPRLLGNIRFENVAFSYKDGRQVLHDVSFDVPAGTSLAIVGSSGIGKSTLLSLLMRFYEPQRGRILIDGQDLQQWKATSVRAQLSVVLQDSSLFAASVRDNIGFARPDASPEEIEEAARVADAHHFIQSLPMGYETMLGERGVNLSQGQRQRLAIARAAVRRPSILLFDEPTTGLDEHSERGVISALNRASAGTTTLMVTHNLRLAATADRILLLQNGTVAEAGTHAELMSIDGGYAQMYRLQSSSLRQETTAHAVAV